VSARAWIYGGLGAFVVAAWGTLEQKPASVATPLTSATPREAPSPPTVLLAPMSPPPAPVERAMLDPAMRDPFMIVVPAPPPPAPAPPPVAVKPPEPPPPPPPAPPPLNLRFTGRMLAPDGALLVFANLGTQPVVLAAGTDLPNGYRVETVTATAVELLYPPLGARARLDLPAAPAFEVR
jgi:hypothetical protein